MSSPVSGLVPVHIGQLDPSSQQAVLMTQRRQVRTRVPGGLAWQQHGLEPRWVGMETNDCAAAIAPSNLHNSGADECRRFLAGAGQRGDVALVVAVIGDIADTNPRSVMSEFDASIYMGGLLTKVSGRRLPTGTRLDIAPDLNRADRDLALRLRARPADAPWWALTLSGTTLERAGWGSETHAAEGELRPILVDGLGDPVVATWTSPSGDLRWYIVPDATDWDTILGWLADQALPAYVPAALRRVRSPHFVDPDLQTVDELAARQALTELEARYAEDKLRLEEALERAKNAAEPIRYGLLYGSGSDLVAAVSAALTAAGLNVVDLDQALDATKSADLLVSFGAQQCLVEVKAAGGAAAESLVGHLHRHLETWPQLRPDEPVNGGVLVVNHQHKLHPSERTAHVYSRPEFVASLTVPVIGTVELFNWWRTSNWTAIRTAVLGTDQVTAAPGSNTLEAATLAAPVGTPTSPTRRRWWRFFR